MKRYFLCLVFIVAAILLIATDTFAAEWTLKRYNNEWAKVTNGIEKNDTPFNLTPVGIACTKKYIFVLSVPKTVFNSKEWLFIEANSVEGMQGSIMSMSKNGYVPFDLDISGNSVNMLFIKVESKFEAWQMVTSSENVLDFKKKAAAFLKKGYIPTGVTSLSKGSLSVLMLKIKGLGIKAWEIYSGPFDERKITNVINDYYKNGYVPVGLHIDGNRCAVIFLNFGK